jgi:serine/threonine protein kinase
MEATDNNDIVEEGHECGSSPEPKGEAVEVNWSMFEVVKELGGGAFGKVYKVRCLASTKVCDAGGERVLMRTKTGRQSKAAAIKQRVQQAVSKNGSNTEGRYLLQDEYYVIKVIDVAEVPEKVGMEALNEIEIMGSLDSPYIVGYIDSFIADQKIHIVLEYCAVGDLNSLVEKQR